ncbi:hypothetical protein JYU29_11565 [Tianweitania sp. BSSL-BM11]|uniref:PepSY domain-containing protein n=1 Tax=Tianweitania aestuarii TaxID=2814886 RepID=A0ABS5RW81_9HYPH|nr:hypothetical protein [Tianweitania aestuarii]MBS9721326.1 hypothetical protein [Tianweitania aestuarii]
MHKVLTSAGLALAVTVGSLGGGMSIASAQGIQLEIGPNGIRPVERERERDRRGPPRRGCSERDARAAARDEGLRDVEVTRVTPRSVTVEGETRRGRVITMRFANERGCPEL